MKASLWRRNNCRLCGGKELELVLRLTPSPIADAYVSAEHLNQAQPTYPLELFLCRSCGHSQLLDVVDPQVIYADYLYEMTSSPGLVKHFGKYADEVLRRLSAAGGSLVVDIGSNDGTLLSFFRNRGMRVLGIDPTRHIARKASQAGIETIPAFFNAELARRIRSEHGPAAIVTASHLFANVDDLADVAEGIRELLAPEGVFVFESFYLFDLIEKMIFDFIYHEHLSYFSVKPLMEFFRRFNMELIDLEHTPAKGGSLRYYFQLNGAGKITASAFARTMADREDGASQRAVETFKKFAEKIENRKSQVMNKLGRLKAEGKTIAGYGASATTTTLIYHFGLGKTIDYIVDDNPAKQNRFSPGYHLPVLPSKALYERKPDYVLILAWRYAEAIIQKHRGFLEQGGGFILPLPEPEIIEKH